MAIAAATIKERRQGLGLTQLDVSLKVGVSLPAFRLWEGGGTKPTADNEEKLRQVLKLGGSAHGTKHGTTI